MFGSATAKDYCTKPPYRHGQDVQVNAFVLQLYGMLRDSISGEAFVSHTGDLHACVDVNLARILVRMQ